MSYDIRSFRLGTECMIVHFTLELTISGQLQLLMPLIAAVSTEPIRCICSLAC